ncbi:MAG: hypothetical protein IJS69_06780 [Selenomonadaceae bacterium]|nr:hypothetical protein [Selenomonadaceae bacterium]
MKFQVTFNDTETALVQQYMKDSGKTIDEIVLRALLERIFDDDAKLYDYEVARDKYKANPTEENLAELKKHFWKGETEDDF